jgi:hypothetical protein
LYKLLIALAVSSNGKNYIINKLKGRNTASETDAQ